MSDLILPEVKSPDAAPVEPTKEMWVWLKTYRGPRLEEIQEFRRHLAGGAVDVTMARRYLGRANTPEGFIEFFIDGAKDEVEALAAYKQCATQAFQEFLQQKLAFHADVQRQAQMNMVAQQRMAGGQGMKHGKN